jgi:hypothetical protein
MPAIANLLKVFLITYRDPVERQWNSSEPVFAFTKAANKSFCSINEH